ncbi:MAG: division/cell wall cluster transcriptional repressor MraZ [Dehalococcoidia bacterium]
MFFRGTYEHTVDDRGRVALPARYRHLFTDGVVMAQGPEGCVEVYTVREYEQMAEMVADEPATAQHARRRRRAFFSRSWDGELDRQGRILIPPPLRQWAQLNGAVTISGRHECLEIWNRDRWEGEMGQVAAIEE